MSDQNKPEFNENSLDSKITELLTLQRLDTEDRAEFRKEVRGRLESIEKQCKITNGRITKLEDRNTANKEIDEEIKQVVTVKQFIQKYLINKYAVIIIGIFTVGVIRVLSDDQLRGFAFKLLGFS